MRGQTRNQVRRNDRSLYATREDYVKVFPEDMNRLCLLSFLPTGDHAKAEKCLVNGIDDCVKENLLFRRRAGSRRSKLSWKTQLVS